MSARADQPAATLELSVVLPCLNEARTVTNLIGNGVATIAIARWDRALDAHRLDEALNRSGSKANVA